MKKRVNFSLADIQKSKVAHLNQHVHDPKPVKEIKPRKDSKSKNEIHATLTEICQQYGLELTTEHRFHEFRKFRFDWCIISKKIAIEYEGIFSGKSRHTTLTGYTKDTDKYNLAATNGWTVLRYTNMNYSQLEHDLKRLL